MAGKAGAQRGIGAKALKYFLDHPGTYVRIEDIAHELDATDAQAANAITYIIREGKLPGLSAVQKGHVWHYEPQSDDGEEHWLVIRHTANGAQVVLEDGNGDLWIAKPVGV